MRFNGILRLVKKMIGLLNMELYFVKVYFVLLGSDEREELRIQKGGQVIS